MHAKEGVCAKLSNYAFSMPETNGMNGVIRVLWNCDMGERCINKERPGVHEEHSEMELCRGLYTEALQPDATPLRLERVPE